MRFEVNAVTVLLSLLLSLVLLYPVNMVLEILHSLFFGNSPLLDYVYPFKTPADIFMALGSALFFYIVFSWLEKEGMFSRRDVVVPFLFIVFMAYYVGVTTFEFFRLLDMRLILGIFSFFVYIPYWAVVSGLLASFIALEAEPHLNVILKKYSMRRDGQIHRGGDS